MTPGWWDPEHSWCKLKFTLIYFHSANSIIHWLSKSLYIQQLISTSEITTYTHLYYHDVSRHHATHSHYPDTEPTSLCPILLMPSDRLGSDKYEFDKSLVWLDQEPNSWSPACKASTLLIQGLSWLWVILYICNACWNYVKINEDIIACPGPGLWSSDGIKTSLLE